GALSAGPRTWLVDAHGMRARTSTPLRDSSGFAPDSPAATASMSIHLVPGAASTPICCAALLSECQFIGEQREVVQVRERVPVPLGGADEAEPFVDAVRRAH